MVEVPLAVPGVFLEWHPLPFPSGLTYNQSKACVRGKVMLIKTVKVSQKGQITLPKEMREALGSEVLRLVLRDQSNH